MFCPNCGSEIREGAKFCKSCGAPVESNDSTESAAKVMYAGTMTIPTDDPDYYDDPSIPKGMMRNREKDIHWNYSLDLSRDPFILTTACRIFLASCFAFGLIIAWAFGSSMGEPEEALVVFFIIFLGFGGGLSVIAAIVYYLTMSIGGSMYTVDHLMTPTQIEYTLLGSQSDYDKQKRANLLLSFVSFFSNGLSSASVGIDTNWHIVSEYKDVRKIIANKDKGVIRLKHRIIKNRIYTEPQQYEFVLNYLTSHCQNAKVVTL